MSKATVVFILIFNQLYLCGQAGLSILLPEIYSSTADAIHVEGDHAYVMGKTFDTTRIAVAIGKLYKIDILNQEVVDVITINENPIGFDALANMLHKKDGKLFYLAHGHEWRDTIIDNQNVYSHYHLFSYDLTTSEWSNKVFPAYNDWGRQFVNHWDAFLTDDFVYVLNSTDDYDYTDTDILVTKLDYSGNVQWNIKYPNELGHSLRSIIVDNKGYVIVAGLQFFATLAKDEGFRYLYLYKIDPDDGRLIKKYLSTELLTSPRALIDDPRGGYIMGADDAIFQEGDRYPAIPQILKIDSNLDSIVWRLQLSDSLSYAFWHLDEIIYLGDNEYLAVGVSDDIIPYRHVGRIVKFTGDGELIFDKEIYNLDPSRDMEQRLNDVAPYKDGFVACGTILANSLDVLSPRQQGWVVYFNGNGENDISSSTDDLLLIDTDYIVVYPNPTDQVLHIQLKEQTAEDVGYKMHSISGSEVLSGTLSKGTDRYQLDVAGMGCGTYVLSLYTKGTRLSEVIVVH